MLNMLKNLIIRERDWLYGFFRKLFWIFICRPFAGIIVEELYGDFWKFRKNVRGKLKSMIYSRYMNSNHFFIGINATFAQTPVCPHGLNGIHISTQSKIGYNVTIFQGVTIGSNTINGHKRFGSPVIGDNVYIGAGAKIIGKISIGDNCRIGANAVVVKDIPSNTIVVSAPARLITSPIPLNNSFKPLY